MNLLTTPILVFDIETIIDTQTGRQLFDLGDDLSDDEVIHAMQSMRLNDSDNHIGTTFMKLPLHKVACLSFLWIQLDTRKFVLNSFSLENMDEKEILTRFFRAFDKNPHLVSYNGKGFDMPVLMYRALHHSLSAPKAFGDHKDSYIARYSKTHTDLIDLLAPNYNNRQKLNLLAKLCNLAGKGDIDGSQVIPMVQNGDWQKLTTYCESDVINTWLLFLRYQLLVGKLSNDDVHAITTDTLAMLATLYNPDGSLRHQDFLAKQ